MVLRPLGLSNQNLPVNTPDTARKAERVPNEAQRLADIELENEEFDSNVPSWSTSLLKHFGVSNRARRQLSCRQQRKRQYRALSLSEREALLRVLERIWPRACQLVMPSNCGISYAVFKRYVVVDSLICAMVAPGVVSQRKSPLRKECFLVVFLPPHQLSKAKCFSTLQSKVEVRVAKVPSLGMIPATPLVPCSNRFGSTRQTAYLAATVLLRLMHWL